MAEKFAPIRQRPSELREGESTDVLEHDGVAYCFVQEFSERWLVISRPGACQAHQMPVMVNNDEIADNLWEQLHQQARSMGPTRACIVDPTDCPLKP